MNWFSAIRRCEELTMEVANDARRDNSRLIQINAYLANEAGKKPNKSNIQQ